jgi:REP element-mobilizing transposase RayT
MIHGYHVIWPAYGFWLPNDPRGSWSETVYAWELLRYGKATKRIERTKIDPELYARWRSKAQGALKYPPVSFTNQQILDIGLGFQSYVQKSQLAVWACSILPEHVHLVLGRHKYKIEVAVNQLKGSASKQLLFTQNHPMQRFGQGLSRLPSMWAEGQWIVYLDSEDAILNAIQYVEENPIREGIGRQHWSFAKPFEGIPSGGWTSYQ